VTWPIRGLIEGFYGPPWGWEDRREVMETCHRWGLSHYVYAPKDDPKHRQAWRVPYDRSELAQLERLVTAGTLRVGFALAPGLSIDYGDADDRAALFTKVDQMLGLGIDLVCLALDDIPPRPGLGRDHAELTCRLTDHVGGRAGVVLVPTEYTGTAPTPYLEALAEGLPEEVAVGWTGPTVVCDAVSAEQARARASALGGRPPLLWDNYPVNDALMDDRLFLGPLRGRDPHLAEACSGYLANPMIQPRCSLLPLASTAAFLRGEDPEAAWRAEADRRGLRVFAEACDGVVPRALVAAVVAGRDASRREALDELGAWLDAAADVEAPGLEHEAGPWVEQVRREAGVGRVAVELLRRLEAEADPHASTELGLMLLYLWRDARRSGVSVMGPRLGLRPVLAQGPDGGWRFREGCVEEDGNAVDALVRLALRELASATTP
jgi:hyaluronoglucosaminidase